MNLKGKNFLKLLDLSSEEIQGLLDLAAELKAKKKAGISHKLCEGKNIALIFEKTSTRTRCAFEVAGHDLGMGVTYLDPSGSQISKKESIADTARVLGRMFFYREKFSRDYNACSHSRFWPFQRANAVHSASASLQKGSSGARPSGRKPAVYRYRLPVEI